MPHIIVEYSRHLEGIVRVSDLVQELHETLAAQGIDKARIRSRARVCDYASTGDLGLHGHMLHTTLLLLEGRDAETKRKYGEALFKVLKDSVKNKVKNCAVSMEIRDMGKDTYYQ